MYHVDSDTPAMARTSNLNEELGQVRFSAIVDLSWRHRGDFLPFPCSPKKFFSGAKKRKKFTPGFLKMAMAVRRPDNCSSKTFVFINFSAKQLMDKNVQNC